MGSYTIILNTLTEEEEYFFSFLFFFGRGGGGGGESQLWPRERKEGKRGTSAVPRQDFSN